MVTVPEGLESYITFILSSFLLRFLRPEPDLGFPLNSFFAEEINPRCKTTWETSFSELSERKQSFLGSYDC